MLALVGFSTSAHVGFLPVSRKLVWLIDFREVWSWFPCWMLGKTPAKHVQPAAVSSQIVMPNPSASEASGMVLPSSLRQTAAQTSAPVVANPFTAPMEAPVAPAMQPTPTMGCVVAALRPHRKTRQEPSILHKQLSRTSSTPPPGASGLIPFAKPSPKSMGTPIRIFQPSEWVWSLMFRDNKIEQKPVYFQETEERKWMWNGLACRIDWRLENFVKTSNLTWRTPAQSTASASSATPATLPMRAIQRTFDTLTQLRMMNTIRDCSSRMVES